MIIRALAYPRKGESVPTPAPPITPIAAPRKIEPARFGLDSGQPRTTAVAKTNVITFKASATSTDNETAPTIDCGLIARHSRDFNGRNFDDDSRS